MENKASGESFVDINGVGINHEKIFNVVNSFYQKVEKDNLLKIPFQSVHDWPEHIERLTHFWWLRFGGKPYMFSHYNPVTKHYFAGFNKTLLEHWLHLFHKTLDEELTPEQAASWKEVSQQMGKALNFRNDIYKKQHEGKLKKGNFSE